MENELVWSIDEISKLTKDVPDFPKEGIVFKDITPILENNNAFKDLCKLIAKSIPSNVTQLLAIESRGFIFGAGICQYLDAGLVLIRKPGKLPRETFRQSYELEYGTDTLEIHKDAIDSNDKVVIIDDVLATGGTAQAAASLALQTGAELLGFQFLMEIEALQGRARLDHPVTSYIKC